MPNKRFPKREDKVRIVDCKDAEMHKGKTFTVKGEPRIEKHKVVVSLNELKGSYCVKNIEII